MFMKNTTLIPGIIFFIFCIGIATNCHAQYDPSIPINHVRTWDILAPVENNEQLLELSPQLARQTTQYIDGLGRPLQTVARQASYDAVNNKYNDMVSPVAYDAFGRERQKYLPYVSLHDAGEPWPDNGNFKYDPFNHQQYFYSDNNTQSPIFGQGESFYYSQTDFEASPLNRPIKTYSPGNSWVGNGVGAGVQYLINTKAEHVKIWQVTGYNSYIINGDYDDGLLYKTVTTDEQSHKVVEYKDKEGKLILKKVQVENSNHLGIDHEGWLCTYYVYDDFNQLRLVIPPKAVEYERTHSWAPIDAALSDNLCFKYEYDQRNRMVLKKVPGAAPVHMVYDNWDRLVCTQDGNLFEKGKWQYTKYDELNRPIYTGLMPFTSSAADLQSVLNTSTLARYETFGASNPIQYSLNQSYPAMSTVGEILTVTYYDDYVFAEALGAAYKAKHNSFDDLFYKGDDINHAPLYAQPLTQSLQTKGMVTGTMVNTLSGTVLADNWLPTVMFYDEKSRPLQTLSRNASGGVDIATTQYNFAGQPLRTIQSHQKMLAGQMQHTIITTTTIEYDALQRLAQVKKKIEETDGGNKTITKSEKVVAKHEYDALGQLKNKKLGLFKNKDEDAELESLGYEYNIRGWLIGINKNYIADPGNNQHFFGMELAYDKNTAADNTAPVYAQPQLNGNIAGTMWRTKGDEVARKYDYAYDNVNRLLRADFIQKNTGDVWDNSTVNFNVKMGDGDNYATAYDENGNILRMQQWGMNINSSAQIDDLRYSYYDNTNQLKNVTDRYSLPASTLGDFKTSLLHTNYATKQDAAEDPATTPAQYAAASTDYTYDVNGNLEKDENKDILSISYNLLNLPQIITLKNNKGKIEYLYDAAGNKLSKTTTEYIIYPNKTIVTTTTYMAGFVYESKTRWDADANNPNYTDKLLYTGHEEGRVRYNAVTEDQKKDGLQPTFCFDYFIKDHLGNIRMVLTDEGKEDKYPAATLEASNIESERLLYNIPEESRREKSAVSGYPNDERTDPNDYVQKLGAPETKVGSSIVLKVMAGDKFNASASSWYKTLLPTTPSNASGNLVNTLIGALASGASAAATAGGHALTAEQIQQSEVLAPGLSAFFNDPEQFTFNYSNSRPRAFLNWILVDEQFVYITGGAQQVPDESEYQHNTASAHVYPHVFSDVPVTKNGYLYVYVSNETTNIPVLFDNLQVTHYRGAIFEETHYYPFGLVLSGISSKAAGMVENKIKFQEQEFASKEFSDGSGLEMYEFKWRMHDPQTGRFWQIDPLSEKYVYNSTYAFSENKVTGHRELEGLESVPFMDWIRDAVVHLYNGKANLEAGLSNKAAAMNGDNSNLPAPIQNIKSVTADVQIGAGVAEMNQPALETIANGGLMLVGVETPGVGALVTGSPVVKESVSLAARADAIQGLLPGFTQTKTTTAAARAIASDGNPVTLVASSEYSLRPAQRAGLNPGEIAVSGQGHAEQTILNHAAANGMTVNQIAASRPICANCATAINNAGATATTPLKEYSVKAVTDSYVKPLIINLPKR